MKPELLITGSDDVPKDRFFIADTKSPIDESETLFADNTSVDFFGGNNIADTWIGWGIVRMLVNSGKQAVMMFRKDQEISLPGGQDGTSE